MSRDGTVARAQGRGAMAGCWDGEIEVCVGLACLSTVFQRRGDVGGSLKGRRIGKRIKLYERREKRGGQGEQEGKKKKRKGTRITNGAKPTAERES